MLAHNLRQPVGQTISKHFGDEFAHRVVQSNGPVILDVGRVLFLGKKTEESLIHSFEPTETTRMELGEASH